MATFKVKTFNELSGKGQNGDIAIIERADINGNKGFSFRDGSGWALPFVQVETLGSNLMTTNTSQSVSAAKTFQGEVVVNDDFSVIGATDIDLGFTGNLIIDAGNETNSKVTIDNVEDIELSADAEVAISADSLTVTTDSVAFNVTQSFNVTGTDSANSISLRTVSTAGTTDNYGTVQISDDVVTIGSYIETITSPVQYCSITSNTSSTGGSNTIHSQSNHLNGSVQSTTLTVSDLATTIAVNGNGTGGGPIEFKLSQQVTPSANVRAIFTDSRPTKLGIEYAADYSSELKVNARSIIDAGTMTVMLEDYISTVPTYADNAAAVTGLLAVGKMYKTATGELRIVV